MSGPVKSDDVPPVPQHAAAGESQQPEVITARKVAVGSMDVNRLLPRRARRTIGPWCFLDHMGPTSMAPDNVMEVGPHPHMGLQTVTWLLSGQAVHRDSMGVEQAIRPGQLNLMTAGRGVAHAEQSPAGLLDEMHGVQLWIAQPDSTRHGDPRFEHFDELPQVEFANARATVVIGELAGQRSPASRDTQHMGADLALRSGTTQLGLDTRFEHGVIVLTGAVEIGGQVVSKNNLAYLGQGLDELRIRAEGPARIMLIGGEPFGEDLLMWWNFVARTRDEVIEATARWQARDERFGAVDSPLGRIDAPSPPWAPTR